MTLLLLAPSGWSVKGDACSSGSMRAFGVGDNCAGLCRADRWLNEHVLGKVAPGSHTARRGSRIVIVDERCGMRDLALARGSDHGARCVHTIARTDNVASITVSSAAASLETTVFLRRMTDMGLASEGRQSAS
jgi:hypothetical protein